MPPRRRATKRPAAPSARLTPGSIARALFTLEPDRDEHAPQLCTETLLTLHRNGYTVPATKEQFRTPKTQRFAVRSLATGQNFLAGRNTNRAGDGGTTPEEYGAHLAAGGAVSGSANLDLAQQALRGLIDPGTTRGQPGVWLLRPFHESLLWYDARRSGTSRPEYGVRKVQMRGSGITVARMLTAPADPAAAELGRAAVEEIKSALTAQSPLADISRRLDGALPPDQPYTRAPDVEDDEWEAWVRGESEALSALSARLCEHAEGIMRQQGASPAAKLWQLRSILALDLASHVIRTAWDVTQTPTEDRYLLMSFGRGPRPQDAVRLRSEESYTNARIRLGEATVHTLAERMYELANGTPGDVDWSGEFQTGSILASGDPDSVASQLGSLSPGAGREEFRRIARAAVEVAEYSRGAEDGFRVLLESVGALVGTGRYRYFTASPDLLSAMVGSLSARMPMPSREFFAAARREWSIVVNQESAADTALSVRLDGDSLERNARQAEKLMSDAGLALALSDRTTMVGERAARGGVR